MAFFKEELMNVKAFIFDVDGVLSLDYSPLNDQGEPTRTSNVKDGFAIRYALTKGYPVGIITGAKNDVVRVRHEKLGVTDIYMAVKSKLESFNHFLDKHQLNSDNILYMGDDLPDHEIMIRVGIPTCPRDAVAEIKAVSKYISNLDGGRGCVRDVIEQVLRAQGNWIEVDQVDFSSF